MVSPNFENPPVVEVVIGVQFEPLKGYSSAHPGWFWKEYMGPGWTKSIDAARLEDQIERFGDAKFHRKKLVHIRPSGSPDRIQIVNEAEDRMVQIQETRFIYNWRRQTGPYPSYPQIRPEFFSMFEKFCDFVTRAGIGPLRLNQWEVTYVNHIPRGDLWLEPSQWDNVIPGFYVPAMHRQGQGFETFGGEWNHVLGARDGRLLIAVRHGKLLVGNEAEVLIIQLTSRGGVSSDAGDILASKLDQGHDAIVESFVAMTSEAAHLAWGRRA